MKAEARNNGPLVSAAESCAGRRQEESGPPEAQGLSGGIWAMGSLRKALLSGEKCGGGEG